MSRRSPEAGPPPSVELRSARDIQALDRAAAAARAAARRAVLACREGLTTAALAEIARREILSAGANPAFEGYRPSGAPSPFPAAACVSVNEQALHAPPGERRLRPGDLVTVDVGVELEGWLGDYAESVVVPGPAEPVELLRAAQRAAAVAIRACRPGVWWSAVARAVRASLASEGWMALPGYAGHGIGRALHEQPRAAYDARPGDSGDFVLLPGMVFTIEPVVVSPPGAVRIEPDGWTVRTADGSSACHLERTVAITRAGARVLGLCRSCRPAPSGL